MNGDGCDTALLGGDGDENTGLCMQLDAEENKRRLGSVLLWP